jgi:putative heme-binding domain-containing protein
MTRFCLLTLALLATLPLVNTATEQPGTPKFEFQPGDHIAIVGNTLAERLQYDGWLETYLHARFPKHDLSVRNLGFSADELTIKLRSKDFGSPDKWLGHVKADVIFAFFGYNESFAGKAGLGKFKNDLDGYLKQLLAAKYNGKSGPRVVLFSPIAHENLNDRNLPGGTENNKRLALYTAAMADIAKANKVTFVDLFEPTQKAYAAAKQPLTINGVHLTEDGDRVLAEIIDQALFGGGLKATNEHLEQIRSAVRDRSFHWYNRYRTVDGYSIYGGRADLKFTNGQTNREVMQREMQILDQMTANRDKVVWAAAQGKTVKADDSNLPGFIPVITNKPGPLAGGKHLYLDPDDAIKKMTVAQNMKVNLFASEKEFPELVNPVQMTWDAKGRLWVAVWPTYPHWKPGELMNDKILILEDTKGTGKADKCTVFADGLHCPTGMELWNGGVLIAQQPNIMFLKDTKGTGKADLRVRVIHGMDSADTHHASNSFVLDPGGAVYWQEGTFHHTQVETAWGPPVRNANAGVYRYEPRTQKFEVYVNFGFANPHGHVFDRWGQDIVIDGTGAVPFHAALFSGQLDYPQRHKQPPTVYNQKTRPCPGMEILSSSHFPDHMQGNLLVANVIGFQGILRIKLDDKGASFSGTHMDPILSSTDPNFRPSDLRIGPDGALYFLDWHNPIIGHMQHNLRDPSRDREHGRIYRVTYEGRELLKSPKIAGEAIDKVLDLLKSPEDRVRYRARQELGARNTDDVINALTLWINRLDNKDFEYEHHMLEALWLHQNHNVVNPDLLKRMLTSPDFRARAAATRVLCYWRDRVPDAMELLKKQAADQHPRVRLEAVRAASFFREAEAVEIALVAMEHPTDVYLDFVRGETMRQLDQFVKKAIADGRPIKFTTDSGARYFIKNVATEDLVKMKPTQPIYLELLFRQGVRDEHRKEAVAGLAKLQKKTELAVLLDAIHNQDQATFAREESVAFDLVRLLTDRGAKELKTVRTDLEKLAIGSQTAVTRQLGFVALIAADNDADKAWTLATQSVRGLQDLVQAVPLIRDPSLRASMYGRVDPLLKGLPADLAAKVGKSKTTTGRYVRIELPGQKKTLTLAEVEVYSDGRNVARQGKATQISTAHGGDASRGIDGNTSGSYGDNGQTHTAENVKDPWWEVDLGKEYPIGTIVIYNRTDGELGKRLEGYTLKVLDANRNAVVQMKKLPAPEVKATFEVGSESAERLIRRAAMSALVSVRGQEAAAFKALVPFAKAEEDRHPALQALLRIPPAFWPKDEAAPLLTSLLEYVRKVPVKERTTPEVLDAMQVAEALTTLLPAAEAKAVRKELGELGVRVIRIGTLQDQMLFDKDRIVVRAGKAVEILFDNTDIMPHNFVVVQPGSLEEIGKLAEDTGADAGAMARHYVPASSKVLLSSRLLQPRQSQKLSFTAPTKPGVYPYVCTYPGHWRRMYGAILVVEDLDEYLADPAAYLAKNPLPIADEMLKVTRTRTEWKYDDLAASIEKLDKERGRSFGNGKQMFTVASCVSCHKVNGVGIELGPDLTKLDPKQQKPLEVLRDILEPSFRINEKYQSYIFETQTGKIITGMIVEETKEVVKIVENPLLKAEPVVLKVADIASRKKSPTSIMPKGLLDTLTREEILDLVAYIVSRGDPEHPLFMGGNHDHGKKEH